MYTPCTSGIDSVDDIDDVGVACRAGVGGAIGWGVLSRLVVDGRPNSRMGVSFIDCLLLVVGRGICETNYKNMRKESVWCYT